MSQFVNTTGYLNNSPHKNNPFNIIKSKVITMNNVNIPLLLRPNKGKSVIAMPNSGEYVFPKADYVFEKPLFQKGGFDDGCPDGFTWSVADQQCLSIDQSQASNFSGNKNNFITGAINPNGVNVGGTGAQFSATNNNAIVENQNPKLKRVFGTPNIPAITASNLLGYGLATFANSIEQGRQKAFMMKQMNNPLFNGSYSNAQNDYGVDPYEQTGQLRQQFQKGGVRDYLYSKGVDGSYENRKKLFGKYFDNYTGTAEQNIILMKKLQSGEIKLNNQKVPQKRYEDNIPKTLIANPEDKYQITPFFNTKPVVNKTEQKVVQKIQPKQQQKTSPVVVPQKQIIGNVMGDNVSQVINKVLDNKNSKTKPAVNTPQKPTVKSGEQAAFAVAANILEKNNFVKPSTTGNAAVDYYIDQIIKSGGKKILITDKGTKKTYYGTPGNIKSFDVLTGKNDDPKAVYGSDLTVEQIDALKGKAADVNKITPLGKFKLTKTDNTYGAPGLRMGNSPYLYHTVYPGELKQRMAAINSPNAADNNMSYGCINCKKPDIQALTNMFSTGDEGYTIDSRLPISEIEKAIKNNKIKKSGGFFQRGGSFNPIEYLYGDDDKEQIQKQEAIVAKKPRVTEEDIDNSNEELKMLGLSEEDILGMIRPTKVKRQNYQPNNEISTSSGVNPLVLKTQKDIFKQFSDVTNLGIWGDKAHQKRKSDHNTGDAQDFGIKDIESGNAIANKLIAEAKERGIKYIVFNNKIWNPSISNEWRPYRGSNPHKTHVHVSYNKDLKMFEQGGEYVVDFATMKELQSKGIKFKIL